MSQAATLARVTPAAPTAPGGSRRRVVRSPLLLSSIVSLLLLIVVQDALSRAAWINPSKFPPAWRVLDELLRVIVSGDLWKPLGATLSTWFLALTASLLIALVAGLLIGLNRAIYHGTRATIEFLRPIPSTALIPLVILSLGANFQGALFLTCFGTLWQLLPVCVAAVKATDPVALDVARSLGLSKWQILRAVIIPGMYPYIKTAIRIGSSAALVLLISMEFLAGITGIGKEVSIAYAGSNYPRLYAFVIVAAILGVLSNVVLAHWARRAPFGETK